MDLWRVRVWCATSLRVTRPHMTHSTLCHSHKHKPQPSPFNISSTNAIVPFSHFRVVTGPTLPVAVPLWTGLPVHAGPALSSHAPTLTTNKQQHHLALSSPHPRQTIQNALFARSPLSLGSRPLCDPACSKPPSGPHTFLAFPREDSRTRGSGMPGAQQAQASTTRDSHAMRESSAEWICRKVTP